MKENRKELREQIRRIGMEITEEKLEEYLEHSFAVAISEADFVDEVYAMIWRKKTGDGVKVENTSLFKETFNLNKKYKDVPDWFFSLFRVCTDYFYNGISVKLPKTNNLRKDLLRLMEESDNYLENLLATGKRKEFNLRKIFNKEEAISMVFQEVVKKLNEIIFEIKNGNEIITVSAELTTLMSCEYTILKIKKKKGGNNEKVG